MQARVRGPGGVSTITLDIDATVGTLRSMIATNTGINSFDLKTGYPPRPLNLDGLDDDILISETGLTLHGEQIIVSERAPDENDKHATKSHQPGPGNEQRPIPNSSSFSELSVQPSTSSLYEQAPSLHDPPEIPLPSREGILILRVCPDDNSCLFRAISMAVLGPDLDSMHELRSVVASRIAQNPSKYSAAVLEKDPSVYCRWIQTEAAWGGAIEIGILAEEFGYEIASINVQDGRVDRFNEGAPQRLILVYSGIHYDVVALTPADRLGFGRKADASKDTKIFDANDAIILGTAQELCEVLRQRHYYTDTAGFLVKCNVCGWSGNGETAATEHAKATGHMNFGEAA